MEYLNKPQIGDRVSIGSLYGNIREIWGTHVTITFDEDYIFNHTKILISSIKFEN